MLSVCALTLTCGLNAMQKEAVASTTNLNQENSINSDVAAKAILQALPQAIKKQAAAKNLTQEELLQAIKATLDEMKKDQKSIKHATWATFGIVTPICLTFIVADVVLTEMLISGSNSGRRKR